MFIGYLLILFVPIFSNMIIKRGNSIIVNIDISEVMALKNKNWTKLYSFLIYVLVKMITAGHLVPADFQLFII